MTSRATHLAICARVARHGLIGAECRALTGGVPDADGVATCTSVELVDRAAYVQRGMEVLASGPDVEALVDAIAQLDVDADRFRIDLHDPPSRLASSTTAIATAIADVLPFGPDLKRPVNRFVVVAMEDEVAFGRLVAETQATYRPHEAKPWTTSSSLDSRFARALVNLVPGATSILDPCCGAGSIVLEAASLGIAATGVDWKAAMVGMTNENLARFGYTATVERADSRMLVRPADAVVTDLPYGKAIEADEVSIRSILERCVENAPIGVYVAPADITGWLRSAGCSDVEVHTVAKRAGFTRWVHVARR